MAYEHIRVTRDDGVVTLIFNRPETRNSMTPAMGEEVASMLYRISTSGLRCQLEAARGSQKSTTSSALLPRGIQDPPYIAKGTACRFHRH